MMKESFTAVIKQSNNWWIGWIEEISGVNCQEATKEELLESLRITLKEALDFNRYEALEAAGDIYEEELIAL
jgi:predicted RNase H-like HicB family nuclease